MPFEVLHNLCITPGGDFCAETKLWPSALDVVKATRGQDTTSLSFPWSPPPSPLYGFALNNAANPLFSKPALAGRRL